MRAVLVSPYPHAFPDAVGSLAVFLGPSLTHGRRGRGRQPDFTDLAALAIATTMQSEAEE